LAGIGDAGSFSRSRSTLVPDEGRTLSSYTDSIWTLTMVVLDSIFEPHLPVFLLAILLGRIRSLLDRRNNRFDETSEGTGRPGCRSEGTGSLGFFYGRKFVLVFFTYQHYRSIIY
jgi:hypothetical protein